jgi:hypothetical protein
VRCRDAAAAHARNRNTVELVIVDRRDRDGRHFVHIAHGGLAYVLIGLASASSGASQRSAAITPQRLDFSGRRSGNIAAPDDSDTRCHRGSAACVQAAHDNKKAMDATNDHDIYKLCSPPANFNEARRIGPFCRILACAS